MSNQLGLAAFDLDSAGGTEFVAGISLRISGSGGSTEAKGSSTSALSIPVVIASDQAAVTVASGATFTVQEDGAALTALELIDNPVQVLGTDTYLEGTDSAFMIGAVRNDVLATLASLDNEIAPFQMNANGALYTSLAELNNTAVDVNNGAVSAGTQRVTIASDSTGQVAITGSVDTELPAAAALADATANPTVPGVGSFLNGFNGTTWDRVRVANTGRLQVDVVTGGGSDTPTNPVTEFLQTVDLASNASADLDTTGSTAANTKLSQVEVWSSVAFQADIFTVDNSVESTNPLAVGGGQPMSPFIYKPPHRNFITLGSTAGNDAYRVKVTNLDDSRAADINATVKFED